MNETEKEFERQVVKVGYHGEWVPTRFKGREVFSSTNKDNDRNRSRYHVWKLYELPDGGFRILDYFIDETDNRQNIRLSREMCGGEVAIKYPKLVMDAVKDNVMTDEDITLDIEHREHLETLDELNAQLEGLERDGTPPEYIPEDLLNRRRRIEDEIVGFRKEENRSRRHRLVRQSMEGTQ